MQGFLHFHPAFQQTARHLHSPYDIHKKWDAPTADLQLQRCFWRLENRQQLHRSSNSKQDFELLGILEKHWKVTNSILTKCPTRRRLYMILHKFQADHGIPKAQLNTSFLWLEEFSIILKEAHITTRISYRMGDAHTWMLLQWTSTIWKSFSALFAVLISTSSTTRMHLAQIFVTPGVFIL